MEGLPIEIKDAIVEKLCIHCTPVDRDIGTVEGTPWRQKILHVTLLASLCLASRALNKVATRHLYHRPNCEKWWLLARTLTTRSDLRPHVKHLDGSDWAIWEFEENIDQASAYSSPRALLSSIDTVSDEACVAILSHPSITDASLDIMCSLCPSIERLDDTDGDFMEALLGPLCSMTQLRHVEVTADHPETGFDIEDLTGLFRAAPNLTSLCFKEASCCGDVPLTLSHVTSLNLEWCDLAAEDLANVLRLCPNVERLRYISAGLPCEWSEPFTPRQAKQIIEDDPSLRRLKSFHLDMSCCEPGLCWTDEDVDVEAELQDAKQVLTARGIDFTYVASLP